MTNNENDRCFLRVFSVVVCLEDGVVVVVSDVGECGVVGEEDGSMAESGWNVWSVDGMSRVCRRRPNSFCTNVASADDS